MKELSIEEKARAYDEAIKYAQYLINERCKENTDGSFHRADLNKMFPELKENEDERIKKNIKIALMSMEDNLAAFYSTHRTSQKELLTWLEKQGKNNMGISEATKKKLEDNLNKALEKETPESWNEFLEKQGKDNKKEYSVWVGGGEINDYNLSKEEAEKLAKEYKKDDYDDVIVEKQGEQKPRMKPKWLYRLEFRDDTCGLWYNGKGDWCFEEGIGSLDDSCQTKSLLMDYDKRYKQDGRDWFSSCSNKEDLLHWYSKEDARTLLERGFVFTRYLATEYHEYEQETVFIKETALYREEIDFFALMEEQNPAWSEEDETALSDAMWCCKQVASIAKNENDMGNVWCAENWLKSLKDRIQPQNTITDEELTQAKKDAYNDALNKIEYHSGEPTFDDGWSAAIWYLKKKNAQLQNTWKPSEGQLECLGYAIEKAEKDWFPLTNNRIYLTLKALKEQLLELRGNKT